MESLLSKNSFFLLKSSKNIVQSLISPPVINIRPSIDFFVKLIFFKPSMISTSTSPYVLIKVFLFIVSTSFNLSLRILTRLLLFWKFVKFPIKIISESLSYLSFWSGINDIWLSLSTTFSQFSNFRSQILWLLSKSLNKYFALIFFFIAFKFMRELFGLFLAIMILDSLTFESIKRLFLMIVLGFLFVILILIWQGIKI